MRTRLLARGLALAASLAMAATYLLAPAARAEEPAALEQAPALRVAVGPARVPETLAATRPALAATVRLLLREGGVEIHEGTRAPEAAASCAQVAALAGGVASHVVLVDLRENGAGLDVALRSYASAGCKLVAGARASGSASALGPALADAVGRVLPGLEGVPDLVPAFAVGVGELARESRALEALEARELVRAWRALEGDDSLLARELRGRIDVVSADRATPLAERVRLRSARGEATPNDVMTRQLLTDAARGLEGEPVEPRVLLAAGEIRLQRGEADAARPYLERAAELEPRNADVQLTYGRVLAQLSDPGATRALESAAELDPGSSRALEELAQLSAHEPAQQAAVLLRAGDRAAEALDEESAQKSFARVLQLAPTQAPVVKEHTAILYEHLADPERARESWQAAVDLAGPTPARMLKIADASRVLRDVERSQAAYVQALDDLETGHDAARGLGELFNETGRSAEALVVLEKASDLAPRDAGLKRELAVALHATGQSDRALEQLQAAELLAPLDASGFRLQAEILRERGDAQGAAQRLEQAIELDPVDGALRAELAGVHDLLGDSAAAALEREHAQLLAVSSSRETQLTDSRAGGATREAAPAVRDLTGVDGEILALVQSFGALESEVGRVALLGVREPPKPLRRPATWLTLRAPSASRADAALARALGGLYDLAPAGDLARALENAANAELANALYRFESQASLDASAVAQINLALGSDAVFVARLEANPRAAADGTRPCSGDMPWRLELRQLSGRAPSGARILGNAICLGRHSEYAGWNAYALGLYGSIALFILFQLVRGWGNVVVQVDLPPQTRALFSISLSRRPRKVKATASLKNKERARWRIEEGLQRLNRYERPLRQGSATRFTWIPARWRSYYVTVRGPLTNATTGELIGDFLEEQQVRVRRGKSAQTKFDLRPKETSIEISVSGVDKASGPVAVALRGDPKSLRYVSDAPKWLYLKQGTYTLVVGHGDRLFERLFEVRSFDAMRMPLDLNRQEWLFTGSRAAVTAYLECDYARAAEELERAGQTKAAAKIRATLLKAKGDMDAAAKAFESGGDLRAAAEAKAATSDRAGAAKLFEDAGEFDEAAEAYRAAGDWVSASRAYERAGEFAQAIECCKQAGDQARLLDLYEKNGDSFEAGELAIETKQPVRAIHAFAQVDRIDPNYRQALRRLVELHMERGQAQPALDKLVELVELEGGDDAPLPLRSVQARLLEKLGRGAEALDVWESIEAKKPGFPRAAERIAELRGLHRGASQPAAGGAATVASAAPAPPAESRYEILEELGRGAMGVVYKARDTRLGRTVALKRLTDNLRSHPTAIAYFEREARSAAVLSHPNVVIVYDAGQENGHYFITMEYLQGTTLEQIVKTRGPMNAQVVASLGIQVCAGLHYAHSNKIIHRDIKTANLFFTKERIVKIMDFGLAKMVEEVRRGATMIGGTPYYMAPEQATGDNVDHRADLYALGVTLWNLLTNAYPFEKGDVTFHHRNTPAPDPRTKLSTIPADMAELVMKLMAKRREDRCQSAAEVAHTLQQIATRQV